VSASAAAVTAAEGRPDPAGPGALLARPFFPADSPPIATEILTMTQITTNATRATLTAQLVAAEQALATQIARAAATLDTVGMSLGILTCTRKMTCASSNFRIP
jgi:hypothetical protein